MLSAPSNLGWNAKVMKACDPPTPKFGQPTPCWGTYRRHCLSGNNFRLFSISVARVDKTRTADLVDAAFAHRERVLLKQILTKDCRGRRPAPHTA